VEVSTASAEIRDLSGDDSTWRTDLAPRLHGFWGRLKPLTAVEAVVQPPPSSRPPDFADPVYFFLTLSSNR
ncbi:hypothetical protein, partial [Leifsonia aquatica]|uniref:hypothetical protein n=1 Tax=Leifsonia aquatica TaxID=144185 RepID=UPI0019661FA6